MSLRSLQSEFAQCAARLIIEAQTMGYEVTFGDAYRSPEECERLGHQSSCHGIRLALDLNLFKDGEYLTNSVHHKPLGEWWCEQHEKAIWGGAFQDGNHYSFEYKGRK